jgi:hypothetical protein
MKVLHCPRCRADVVVNTPASKINRIYGNCLSCNNCCFSVDQDNNPIATYLSFPDPTFIMVDIFHRIPKTNINSFNPIITLKLIVLKYALPADITYERLRKLLLFI